MRPGTRGPVWQTLRERQVASGLCKVLCAPALGVWFSRYRKGVPKLDSEEP